MSNRTSNQIVDVTGVQPSLNTGGTSFSAIPMGIAASRAPTTADVAVQFTIWDYATAGTVWMQTKKGLSSVWSALGTGAVGGITTLTASSGGALSPTLGNINILGTANQITSAGAVSTITLTLPAAIIAPGSLVTTTTLASGTTLTAGTSLTVTTSATVGTTLGVTGATTLAALTQTGTTNINTTGAAATSIGTGGTGITNIGNATGDTAVTGALTASETLTATLGAITATNGNLVLGTAGNKIVSTSVGSSAAAGANSFGKVVLIAGTITVSTTAVTASSLIMLTRQTVGATGAAALGMLTVGTIVAGVSFDINSWTTASAVALATTDVSQIGWQIIN